MVQRLDICGNYIAEPSEEGDYIKYEDYAELERKLRNFADQVLYAPCSKVTEEMAREILDL